MRFSFFIVVSLCFVLLGAVDVDARNGSGSFGSRGGGSSFSSSSRSSTSFSSKSSSSYSKSAPSVPSKPGYSPPSFGYSQSRTNSIPPTVAPNATTRFSGSNAGMNTSQSRTGSGSFGKLGGSYKQDVYTSSTAKVDTSKFAKQGNAVSSVSANASNTTHTFGNNGMTAPQRSTRYVTRYTDVYQSPPPFMYQTYPSFGVFDALMLYGLMSSMHHNDAAMFYHRQNDPGIQAYMAEMKEMSKDNAELKAKVDNLQKTMDEMAAAKVPVNPDYLPSSVQRIDPLMYEKENIYVDGPDWREKLEKRVRENKALETGETIKNAKNKDSEDSPMFPLATTALTLVAIVGGFIMVKKFL